MQTKNTINDILAVVNIILYTAIALLGFFSSCFIAMNWGIQFHNIDLSYNMALISNDINNGNMCRNSPVDYRQWEDQYNLDQTISYTDAYMTSSSLLRDLLIYGFASVFAFGIGIAGLFFISARLIDEKRELRGSLDDQ